MRTYRYVFLAFEVDYIDPIEKVTTVCLVLEINAIKSQVFFPKSWKGIRGQY